MPAFMRLAAELRESGELAPDPSLGTAVTASFARHTAGRDLMACVLEIEGFRVKTADRYASAEDAVALCLDPEVTALCYSVQATYDLPGIMRVDGLLKEAGIRSRIVFNAGGSPVSRKIAEKARCDVYAPAAAESARMVAEAVRKKRLARDGLRSSIQHYSLTFQDTFQTDKTIVFHTVAPDLNPDRSAIRTSC